jgi:hypothetical protein
MQLPRVRASLFVVLGMGCGFDSGGVGGGGDASVGDSTAAASTSAGDPTAGDPSASGPSATAPGETSDGSITDPSTDPATTDPATTDPSTTDATATDPTAAADSTGDPTETTGALSVGESSGASVGTTGEPPPNEYVPCDGGCADGGFCLELNANLVPIADTCSPTCEEPGDCPIPATGNVDIQCPADNEFPYCVLHCEDGPCPDGMVCYSTNFGDICFWDY